MAATQKPPIQTPPPAKNVSKKGIPPGNPRMERKGMTGRGR